MTDLPVKIGKPVAVGGDIGFAGLRAVSWLSVSDNAIATRFRLGGGLVSLCR